MEEGSHYVTVYVTCRITGVEKVAKVSWLFFIFGLGGFVCLFVRWGLGDERERDNLGGG